MHAALTSGSMVRVRGPRNHFPLVTSARYLFIAGGIGITPILPMIAEAEAAVPTGGCSTAVASGRQWPSSMNLPTTVTASRCAAGRDGHARSGIRPRNAATRHAGLLLRPRRSPRRSREILRELAARRASPGTVLRQAAGTGRRGGLVVRARAGTLGLTLQVPPDKSVLEVIRGAGVAFSHRVWRSLRNV